MLTGSQNPNELRESLLAILRANYDRSMSLGEKYLVDSQEPRSLSNLYACCIGSKFASEYAETLKRIHLDHSRNG